MSADNWATCPKCKVAAQKATDKKKLAAGKAYGKVPAGEYLTMLNEVEKGQVGIGQHLREDYEIGINAAGEFNIYYGATCEKCGFTFEHKHSENVASP